MTVIKTGVSSVNSSILSSYTIPNGISTPNQIGIVIGVITTPNTPTPDLYNNNGKEDGIGTIFYLSYNIVYKLPYDIFDLSIHIHYK
jgi:hypothetical protein